MTEAESILTFLTQLNENNTREWFGNNKARYEKAKVDFENFIEKLIAETSKFDPSIGHLESKKCIFRIYRDVRFSKSKLPYKTNFGAHLTIAGKNEELAGYYIHLEPGKSFLGGGAYQPSADWLKAIRDAIDYDGSELEKIITTPAFKKVFGSIQGEKLSRNPKNYASGHPHIEYLKFKSLTAIHPVKDDEVLSEEFIKEAAKVFKVLMPFNQYLNKALN